MLAMRSSPSSADPRSACFVINPDGETSQKTVFSSSNPVACVDAGVWMAARSQGNYSLVSCCVGPGFSFADFGMLRERLAANQLIGILKQLL